MAIQTRPGAVTDRKGLSGPALRTFFRIAQLWKLSKDEQMALLGVRARSKVFKWKKDPDPVLHMYTLERISYTCTPPSPSGGPSHFPVSSTDRNGLAAEQGFS